jgi:thiosulfate/3-mercaptopyruvate sulfurtransferase
MTRTNPDALASTDWLHEHLSAPDVRIVDASYYLPNEGMDARAEFEKQHIPGAVFFDIDEIADTESDLPHMMPPPEKFSAKVRKLGLGDGSRIVVYDQRGIFSAPRVWWMFRAMGHRDVAVLDGGLPKWLAENKPVEDGTGRAGEERHFTARFDNTMLRDREQVSREVTRQKEQIIDVRAPERFAGEVEEPRQGLPQPALSRGIEPRHPDAQEPRRAPAPVERGRDRSQAAGRDLLRLRRHGGSPEPGAARGRLPGYSAV